MPFLYKNINLYTDYVYFSIIYLPLSDLQWKHNPLHLRLPLAINRRSEIQNEHKPTLITKKNSKFEFKICFNI